MLGIRFGNTVRQRQFGVCGMTVCCILRENFNGDKSIFLQPPSRELLEANVKLT
jgi:hypothetical protein